MRLELYLTDLFSSTATTIKVQSNGEHTETVQKYNLKKDALLCPKEEAPNLSVRN